MGFIKKLVTDRSFKANTGVFNFQIFIAQVILGYVFLARVFLAQGPRPNLEKQTNQY
jgi:hypothetical protein